MQVFTEIPFFKTHIFKADPIVIDKLKEHKNCSRMINLIIVTLTHGDQKRL